MPPPRLAGDGFAGAFDFLDFTASVDFLVGGADGRGAAVGGRIRFAMGAVRLRDVGVKAEPGRLVAAASRLDLRKGERGRALASPFCPLAI
jgi:hypothetical protein